MVQQNQNSTQISNMSRVIHKCTVTLKNTDKADSVAFLWWICVAFTAVYGKQKILLIKMSILNMYRGCEQCSNDLIIKTDQIKRWFIAKVQWWLNVILLFEDFSSN